MSLIKINALLQTDNQYFYHFPLSLSLGEITNKCQVIFHIQKQLF